MNVELKQLPTSVQQFLLANQDAIVAIESEISQLVSRIDEYSEKIKFAKIARLSVKGLKATITRCQNKITELESCKYAYQAGYLEIPNLDRNAEYLEEEGFGTNLPTNAPLRVFEAVAKARENETFQEIVIYNQRTEGDPIVAGIIGDRRFFISAWR